ncbi:hypothetical protein [Aliiroseovarius marinus]|uniref:hypothetical protein n=1 Tax=Aliiroseovarius marinus TaxID=2500159 RepID=UPI003D7CF3E5
MRILPGLALLTLVAACASPTVPDSGAPQSLPDGAVAVPADNQPLSAMIEGSSVESQPLDAVPASSAPIQANGLSDEQSFDAVSSRVSIEGDAARLEQYRQSYQQVQPTAVPERPKGSSVSVVQYALSTTNAVGQSIYTRSSLSGAKRAARNCARYSSADFAQIAFLEAGGPKRDKHGIDPDGDGFACGWNPAPFRAARGGAVSKPVVEDSGVSAADLQALGIQTGSSAQPLPPADLNISTE